MINYLQFLNHLPSDTLLMFSRAVTAALKGENAHNLTI